MLSVFTALTYGTHKNGALLVFINSSPPVFLVQRGTHSQSELFSRVVMVTAADLTSLTNSLFLPQRRRESAEQNNGRTASFPSSASFSKLLFFLIETLLCLSRRRTFHLRRDSLAAAAIIHQETPSVSSRTLASFISENNLPVLSANDAEMSFSGLDQTTSLSFQHEMLTRSVSAEALHHHVFCCSKPIFSADQIQTFGGKISKNVHAVKDPNSQVDL